MKIPKLDTTTPLPPSFEAYARLCGMLLEHYEVEMGQAETLLDSHRSRALGNASNTLERARKGMKEGVELFLKAGEIMLRSDITELVESWHRRLGEKIGSKEADEALRLFVEMFPETEMRRIEG